MTSGGDGNQDDLADAWGADMGLGDDGDIGTKEEGGEQDDLAAAWGADLGIEGDGEGGGDDVAAQWALLVDGGMDESSSERAARLLSQGEIDSLLGISGK